MLRRTMCRYKAGSGMALGAALALVTCAERASGEPEGRAAPAASAQSGSRSSAPVVLVVGSLPASVDMADLRGRLAAELGTGVLDAPPPGGAIRGTLHLSSGDGEITARFAGQDGSVTQRSVPLPVGRDRILFTIVVLAGNVARDEAAELRAELERRKPSGKAPPAGSGAAGDAEPPGDSGGDTGFAEDFDPEEDSGVAGGSDRAGGPGGREKPAPAASSGASRRGGRATRPAAPAEGVAAGQEPWRCAAAEGQPVIVAGADLVPMLGVSLVAPEAALYASLNIVGGRAGSLQGVQIGSAVNILSRGACGLQIAGAVNVARGVAGLQIGGAANAVERARGAQIAGAVNVVRDAGGAQIAGGANIVGDAAGVQIAGGLNRAGRMRGVQITGGLNLTGDAGGVQIAGGVNVASAVRGVQIAPIDVAGSVEGAQIGVVNVAGRVRGAQVGVLNIADESDLSVGVLSVVRRGRFHLDVWGAETGLFMAAFKHGGRYFHNFYGAGFRPSADGAQVAFSLGFGGHIPITRRLFVDLDVLGYTLHRTDDMGARPVVLAQGRAMVGVRLTGGLALVAGPSYNVSFAGSSEDAALSPLGDFVLSEREGAALRGWPGASVGVQTF